MRHAAVARQGVPSFTDHTRDGVRESNPYHKLYEERIVFLGVQVDDVSANDVMAQLLHLEADDPDRDIEMYINSPGGSFTALMAIYDTMRFVRPDVATFCVGQAGSAAATLLAAGTPGKRSALPNARVFISQPAAEGYRGQVSDLLIEADEIQRMRELMETRLAHHTGKPVADVHRDIDREMILDAEQARAYGIVDTVLSSRKRNPNP